MGMLTNLIVAAVVGIAFFAFQAWTKRRRTMDLERVGKALGLQFGKNSATNTPELRGMLDGVRVTLETIVDKRGKGQATYTAVTARINGSLPSQMKIRHEGLFQKVGKVFGGEDIQVGDEALDGHFIFTGGHPRKIRELVTTPAVKSALLTVHQFSKSLRVEHGEVCLNEQAIGEDREKITRFIRMSTKLAAALGDATSAPEQPTSPAQLPLIGRPVTHAGQRGSAKPSKQPASSSNDPNDWW